MNAEHFKCIALVLLFTLYVFNFMFAIIKLIIIMKYNIENFRSNDIFQLPTNIIYGNFDEVAHYLTKNCKNDIEKVRSLFTWTTSIDISSLQSSLEKLPDAGTPLDYLLRIHWQMGNHAHFFAQICR